MLTTVRKRTLLVRCSDRLWIAINATCCWPQLSIILHIISTSIDLRLIGEVVWKPDFRDIVETDWVYLTRVSPAKWRVQNIRNTFSVLRLSSEGFSDFITAESFLFGWCLVSTRRGLGLQDGNEMKEAVWSCACAWVEWLFTVDAGAQR